MEKTLCSLQYVGKNEILLNLVLNNHLKDEKGPKAILVDKPFQKCCHRLNERAKFTIINILTNTYL